MLRKCALIASVLAVFGTPAKAQTTMDVSMKIQAVMDQLSGIRSQLKQVQSAINIKEMKQNLQGGGDWKNMVKQAGGIFDRNAEKGGTKQSLLVLPDGLADAIKNPDEANKWLQENLLNQKKNPTPEEKDAETKKISEFKFTALASSFGKAVATRKQLDKDLATIEKLRQDAEAKESETDLQNEINKVALLKMEQANYRQLLMASMVQVETADSLEAAQSQNKKLQPNEGEETAEGKDKDEADEEKAEDADKKEEKEKSKLEKLKEKAEEKAKKVEKTVNDTKKKVEDKVNDVKEKVEDKVNDVKEKVEDKVNDVKEKVEDKVNDVKEKAEDKVNDAREKVAKAVVDAETKAEGAVKDAKGKVEGAVKDASGKVGNAVKDATSKVDGAVKDAKGKAEGAVKDAKGKAEGAVNGAIDKASAAVSKNGKGGSGADAPADKK